MADLTGKKTIPVKISLTVLVDTEGWAADYGIEGTAEIRKDVKSYVKNLLQEVNDNLDVQTE